VAMTIAATPAAAAVATLSTTGTNRRALAMVFCGLRRVAFRCLGGCRRTVEVEG
jgi:hypothetical protein